MRRLMSVGFAVMALVVTGYHRSTTAVRVVIL
jgi:hypothetical protein